MVSGKGGANGAEDRLVIVSSGLSHGPLNSLQMTKIVPCSEVAGQPGYSHPCKKKEERPSEGAEGEPNARSRGYLGGAGMHRRRNLASGHGLAMAWPRPGYGFAVAWPWPGKGIIKVQIMS